MRVKGISPFIAAALLAIACGGIPALAQNTPAPSANASPNPEAFIKRWDRSGKGLLGLREIEDAAIVKFEMLDKGHKGRLTEQELAGTLTPQEFSTANPDRDNTIGADEWFDLVKHRFYAANVDHDGSLDARELQIPAGQALLRLAS